MIKHHDSVFTYSETEYNREVKYGARHRITPYLYMDTQKVYGPGCFVYSLFTRWCIVSDCPDNPATQTPRLTKVVGGEVGI